MTDNQVKAAFLAEYAARIVSVCGWTPDEAIKAASAVDENLLNEYLSEGVSGSDAADDEIECWSQDE